MTCPEVVSAREANQRNVTIYVSPSTYPIGKNDLLDGFVLHTFGLLLVEARDDMLSVDDGDDAIQLVHLLNILVDEEGLDDRSWVGETSRFDENAVEALDALVELLEGLDQVATDGAADAPVHYLDDFLVDVLGNNFLVDANVPELILDNGEFHPVSLIVENVVKERGFAGTPVALHIHTFIVKGKKDEKRA